MVKISCNVVKDLLPLYIDGICSKESMETVETHLKECSHCLAEYERLNAISGELYQSDEEKKDIQQQENVQNTEYKTSKKEIFFLGIAIIILLLFIIFVFFYSFKTSEIDCDDIYVSDLYELSNGNIYFTLDTYQNTEITNVYWYSIDNYVYITYDTKKMQFLSHKKDFNEFGVGCDKEKNWNFNIEDTGIKGIFYVDSRFYSNPGEGRLVIWEKDDHIESAPREIELLAETNNLQGNLHGGSLAYMMYNNKNEYIGDAAGNGRVLSSLFIEPILGKYVIELQTTVEPYEIILHFKNAVYEEQQAAFDKKMQDYSLLILSLIDNAEVVSWTYPTYVDGLAASIKRKVTLEEADSLVPGSVKEYSISPDSLELLLRMIGID